MSDAEHRERRRGAPRLAHGEPARRGAPILSLERERVGPLPVWGWAGVSGLLVWTLYFLTLAPSAGFWDASEYITTAHIVGIPHPPGNPFFVVVGRSWDVLLSWTGLSVAQRIHLLSASASAGASALWFLSFARVWAHFVEDRRQIVVTCAAAVLVGATAFTVWSQSNVNEKVYTISLFVVALVTYLAMLWEDVADTPRGDRLVMLVAFLLGLGATNHQMSLLPLLPLAVFVLFRRAGTLLRPRLMGAGMALAALGFTLQLFFVPIRSAQQPLIDEADPECPSLWTAAATPLEFVPGLKSMVPDGMTCEPLRAAIAREQYAKPPLRERQSPFSAQIAMYAQYFDWQWARGASTPVRGGATLLFVLLGAVGLHRHWKGDRDSFVYFATLMLSVIPLLVFYLNFRYGYSLYPDVPVDQHEVRERDYFYIVSFNLWGLYAGLGIATLWRKSAERMSSASDGASPLPRSSLLRATPVLGLALLPLIGNYGRADRSADYSARDWAYNLLQSVEPYGVLFTNGDNDTFPLWYLQEVEGIRKDVTVAVHSYLGTSWYPRQLKALSKPCEEGEVPSEHPTVRVCQRPFDPDTAPPLYGEERLPAPDSFVIDLADDRFDTVPPYQVVEEPMGVRVTDRVTARLDPRQLRSLYGQPLVTRGDLFVYLVARSSLGERPVYFAATAPPVFGIWNLDDHLLRQGLAYKTIDGTLESTSDTVRLTDRFDVRWLDLDRTRSLLWNTFHVDYLLDWETWPDPSSRTRLPTQYYFAHLALGEAGNLRGDPAAAERDYRRAEGFLRLSGLGGDAR